MKMKILILFFLSTIAFSQTVVIPSLPVPVPARLIPAQSITVTVPKGCINGCKVSFIVPAQTVPAQTLNTPSIVAPVSIGTVTLNFSCTGPDLQHLVCSAVKQ